MSGLTNNTKQGLIRIYEELLSQKQNLIGQIQEANQKIENHQHNGIPLNIQPLKNDFARIVRLIGDFNTSVKKFNEKCFPSSITYPSSIENLKKSYASLPKQLEDIQKNLDSIQNKLKDFKREHIIEGGQNLLESFRKNQREKVNEVLIDDIPKFPFSSQGLQFLFSFSTAYHIILKYFSLLGGRSTSPPQTLDLVKKIDLFETDISKYVDEAINEIDHIFSPMPESEANQQKNSQNTQRDPAETKEKNEALRKLEKIALPRNADEKGKITECHVIENHGPDLEVERQMIRAQLNIDPRGNYKKIDNNPKDLPDSTQFTRWKVLNKALDKLLEYISQMPNIAANQENKEIIFSLPNVVSTGIGYSSETCSEVSCKKVKAVLVPYNGTWKLLTMFPIS